MIKFAVQLEANGYDFYKEASSKLTAPVATAVFDDLARKELEHKALFEGLSKKSGPPTEESANLRVLRVLDQPVFFDEWADYVPSTWEVPGT